MLAINAKLKTNIPDFFKVIAFINTYSMNLLLNRSSL